MTRSGPNPSQEAVCAAKPSVRPSARRRPAPTTAPVEAGTSRKRNAFVPGPQPHSPGGGARAFVTPVGANCPVSGAVLGGAVKEL